MHVMLKMHTSFLAASLGTRCAMNAKAGRRSVRRIGWCHLLTSIEDAQRRELQEEYAVGTSIEHAQRRELQEEHAARATPLALLDPGLCEAKPSGAESDENDKVLS